MESQFYSNELLFRGILPDNFFWRDDGTISSAVFKNRSGEDGVSVDRQSDRSANDALLFAISHLKGCIATVTVQNVHECGAEVIADPIISGTGNQNEYHSVIIRNGERTKLTDRQSKYLSKVAKIVYRP